MLNYCITCFGLHVCAITCKTLCRWLMLSCMFCFFFWVKTLAVLQFLSSENVLHVYSFQLCIPFRFPL